MEPLLSQTEMTLKGYSHRSMDERVTSGFEGGRPLPSGPGFRRRCLLYRLGSDQQVVFKIWV